MGCLLLSEYLRLAEQRSGVNLAGADLATTDFRGADLSHTNLAGVNLESSILDEADLRQTIVHASVSAARHAFCVNASHANLRGARVDPGFPFELAAVRPDGTETGPR
jgi:uncharacterized protein YjbI with pentapeptide repeats